MTKIFALRALRSKKLHEIYNSSKLIAKISRISKTFKKTLIDWITLRGQCGPSAPDDLGV